MAQTIDAPHPEHPTVTLERRMRERIMRDYADHYAEELVFAANDFFPSFVGTQSILSLCRQRAVRARENGNIAEERSFKAIEPTLAELHSRADRLLYGDGSGDYD